MAAAATGVALLALVAAAAGTLPGGSALAAQSVSVTSLGDGGAFLLGGLPAFPIALSNPPPVDGVSPSGVNGLDEVVRAGVTIFRVFPTTPPSDPATVQSIEAWDSAALLRGVHTWVSLGGLATATPGSRADQLLQKTVTTLTSDSSGAGIGFWKGADEPAWGGPTPPELRFAYCRVTSRGSPRWCAGETSLDSGHLWLTIEAARGTAGSLAPYSRVTDTHGVDVYPIRVGSTAPDLHLVGAWTRTVASVTPNRSVWTTLQICSSGSFTPSGYVLPTRVQERYMIYDAIINGARGLAFFGGDSPGCWSARDRAYGWNWTFWNEVLKSLIQEIAAGSPLGSALANGGSTRWLRTTAPGVEAISRVGLTATGRRLWILAASAASGTADVTIGGLPRSARWASVYTENRAIRVTDGSLTDRFSQWQVHVYELPLPDGAPN